MGVFGQVVWLAAGIQGQSDSAESSGALGDEGDGDGECAAEGETGGDEGGDALAF